MTLQKRLWERAMDQHGFVGTSDARALGVAPVELAKLAHRSQLAHVAHGVYRFPQLPASPFDEFALAVLWTGRAEAALSHDTALAVHELCEINPDRVHVVVPRGVRIRRSGGSAYVLHAQNLGPTQTGWWEGVRVVTPLVAIEQGIAGDVPAHLLEQAIETASRLGYLRNSHALRLRRELELRT